MTEQVGRRLREVRLVGLPIALQARAQEQHAELMREFALLDIGGRHPRPREAVPERLLQVIDDLEHRFGDMGSAADLQRDAAAARGEATVDLTYLAPPEIGVACASLSALLDEADEFCREGDSLLTLAAEGDLVAFRHWYLSEFARQLRGELPTSWADYVVSHAAIRDQRGNHPGEESS